MKMKPEGFPNQRMFRLPEELQKRARTLPGCCDLVVTDTGFFPEATGHQVTRLQGSPTHVLLFCVGGNGWAECEGVNDTMEPGDFIWILPSAAHRYGSSPDDPWRVYWVHLDGPGVINWRRWADSGEEPLIRWHISDRSELSEQFETLWRQQDESGSDLSLIRMSTEAKTLITKAVTARTLPGKRTSEHMVNIDRSVTYMKKNLPSALRLSDCAKAAGMSPPHYSAVFREHTGIPPMKYVARLRLRQASEWLDHTDLPVQEIADRLGYSNPFHFSKAFRQFTGLSPRAYRNRMG
jgi:AraC-like DNA-binding protein